jgi:ketosteroid isomerase-like protein
MLALDPGVAQRVHLTISRYLYALDAPDMDALTTCFTEDIEVIYHAGAAQERRDRGRTQVVGRFAANVRNYSTRTHALANFHVTVADGVARSVSHVVATVVRNQRVMVRGIRYSDELVEEDGGWRIRRREHRPLWQYEALRTRLEVPSTPVESDEIDYSGKGTSA